MSGVLSEIECGHCGNLFVPSRPNKKYCRKKCCDRASAKRTGAKRRGAIRSHYKGSYGLTLEEVEYLRKDGCHICGTKENLCVDHDHTTGDVCGCLCNSCNKALGLFKENKNLLIKAAKYLTKTKKTPKE